MLIDLTSDSANGNPAIAMFTLRGGDFMYNKIAGVGGLDGLSSGVVSSTVAGSKLKLIGVISSDANFKISLITGKSTI